jgi:hypothetical protein
MTNQSTEDLRRRLGNIDQIRDLLFGSKLAEYEERFQQQAQKLEQIDTRLTELKTETIDRLNLLRSDLSNELQIGLERLASQVNDLQLSNTEHSRKSQLMEQRCAQDIDAVKQSLTDQTQFLRKDLMQTRLQMQEEVVKLSEKLTQALYSEVANLQHTKLTQVDLADILFEICLKLKNSPASSSEANLTAISHEISAENVNIFQDN